jgi:hypothetical protein
MTGRSVGSAQSGRRRRWWLTAMTVLAIGGGLWVAWEPRPLLLAVSTPSGTSGDPTLAVARRETRPTLDPARFVGKALRAHQVAREIPDVLDRLYCYCGCDKLAGHKSLLSCFTDSHAAT